MPIVRLHGSERSIEVGKGANLRRSLMLHGINPYAGVYRVLNCYGIGLCGTCWVEVIEGEENLSAPTRMESLNFRQPLKRGRRLACQTRVYGDCVIKLQTD
ncbi:MAG: (2Fe-2S)-binding protein [Armatimonadetes bacterium]|nr:(2Fe-2S)-binding protein [Armatimonadota bacterium]